MERRDHDDRTSILVLLSQESGGGRQYRIKLFKYNYASSVKHNGTTIHYQSSNK